MVGQSAKQRSVNTEFVWIDAPDSQFHLTVLFFRQTVDHQLASNELIMTYLFNSVLIQFEQSPMIDSISQISESLLIQFAVT